MKKFLRWLSRRRFPYQPLITIEISKGRLLHNLEEFGKLAPNGQVAPVLKSNAYGHGLLEIAQLLESSASIPFFVVDSYFEAVALRSRSIKKPLLIIGYTRPEMILNARRLKDVSFTITDIQTLRDIASSSREVPLHIKIDTGMHRQGILETDVSEAIQIIKSNSKLHLQGICSHLASADSNAELTQQQINSWNKIVSAFKKDVQSIKCIHLSGTDGHLFHKNTEANVSRLGIGLYGITENVELRSKLNLQPVLEMKTSITGIKMIQKGDHVGYGNTFTALKDMTIATIPVGYYEGIDRRLSNKGTVLVGSDRTPCPIIGRVSMNIITIDVSNVEGSINTPVVVISNNVSDPNSILGIVENSGNTIPYEMIVKIPAHLKRVITE